MKGVDGTDQEVGSVTKMTSDSVSEGSDADNGRKLLGVQPEIPEAPTPIDPKTKQTTEMISEIENILRRVREQYDKGNQPLPAPESQDRIDSPQSLTDLLKLSASQVDEETKQEDPVVEEARQRYMTAWNEEADRLNAPFMKVNKAWPELGMVYMPTVTEVTDQIKAAESVKQAEQAFKDMWKKRQTETNSFPSGVEPILKIFSNFMGAWSWAQTLEENPDTPEIEPNDQGHVGKTNDDTTHRIKTARDNGSRLGTNEMKGLDSRFGELLSSMFNQRRLQPVFPPSSDSRPQHPLKNLGDKKIRLSCSVEPDVVHDDPNIVGIPATDHRPAIGLPIHNTKPITIPSRVGIPKQGNSNYVPPVRQLSEEQKFMTNPSAFIKQLKDRLTSHVPVSHVAYPGPPVRHGTVKVPVINTDRLSLLPRYPYTVEAIGELDDFQLSEEDAALQSFESEEQPSRQSAFYHRQAPLMGYDQH
ncbi:uncharacterized protein LOC123504578 [Portunus trituberculatus]|uniref:uncharacterized protein LOC123504578 n=1 Tax=Portunus trituberculatus TaxID=210409 RepID=UPI001E1CD549|nr:uncharacterized protein LOC123504578 [Portunus trituberculatus]